MALQVETPKREFIVKKKSKKDNISLPDPHPDMTISEVINFYKGTYPEISTASVDGPKMEEGKAVYSFSTVLGDKG
jgi:PRTRC genetic system protein C